MENGGAREDGVDDKKEGADDDPVELVEQPEVRPSFPHLKIFSCFWSFCRVRWIMCILLCKLLLVAKILCYDPEW